MLLACVSRISAHCAPHPQVGKSHLPIKHKAPRAAHIFLILTGEYRRARVRSVRCDLQKLSLPRPRPPGSLPFSLKISCLYHHTDDDDDDDDDDERPSPERNRWSLAPKPPQGQARCMREQKANGCSTFLAGCWLAGWLRGSRRYSSSSWA